MKVCEVKSLSDVRRVEEAAAADGHVCFAPTHFLESNNGEVRGCFSTAVTALFFWSHKGNSKFDSLRFVDAAKAAAVVKASQTGGRVFWPCTPHSPFVPLLPELGFERLGSADFWEMKGGHHV